MASETITQVAERQRRQLSDFEQMADAQAGCAPCKLCGGKAIITDAGPGAGYYIRCENSGAFRAATGCMVTDARLGGWAYNVMDWWNRLHAVADESAAVAELVEALAEADAAIKEWFRYLHGGEMRGSYDGKPEREILRKAGYRTSAAISRHQAGLGKGDERG